MANKLGTINFEVISLGLINLFSGSSLRKKVKTITEWYYLKDSNGSKLLSTEADGTHCYLKYGVKVPRT